MRYLIDEDIVEIPLPEIYAIAYRNGDLDRRFSPLPERATDGVLLADTVRYGEMTYRVFGYAHDLSFCDGSWCLTMRDRVKKSKKPSEGLLFLSRVLALFAAKQHDAPTVCVRLILTDDGGEAHLRERRVSKDELTAFYLSLLARVAPYAREEKARLAVRLPSAALAKFPYEGLREGQSELAEECYRAIARQKRLFAEAPTGIGKTAATLYPAVRALGKGLCRRIFYLTAKASTRREAFSAAARLFSAGAKLRTVVLYAKEQMCLLEGGCHREGVSLCKGTLCPYAKGYYERSHAALAELLDAYHGFSRAAILEAAKKYRVCPYELSLDLSLFCEIIVCDYNYVFDPAVFLRRYFDENEGERADYVFLVDEAHNLPDRARDMYSARLSVEPFESLYAKLSSDDDGAESVLGGFLMGFRRLADLCTENRVKRDTGESGYAVQREPIFDFMRLAEETQKKIEAFLRGRGEHPLFAEFSEILADLRRFCLIGEYYDERYLTFLTLQDDKISVQLYCLDPAGVLFAALSRSRAAILFSATLTPPEYFSEVMGSEKEAMTLRLASPYPTENLAVAVVPTVDTRLEEREKSYRRVVSLIAGTLSARAGNYIVYFPSYAYMESVYDLFRQKYPAVETLVQEREKTRENEKRFFEFFKDDKGVLRVGFCLLGGSFAEGVDLPGDRLIGAVIVGTGTPGISNERNLLRDYYENKNEAGYDYAYLYPGMNRVLQAAGRVIRRAEDRGVVVLIDSRYAGEPYLHLYPAHWKNITVTKSAADLAGFLSAFWQKRKEAEKN